MHFGDLIGRKRIFTFSIILMAAPTLAIGLLPSYSAIGVIAPIALLILRVLQGAAIGGEIPGAWVFVSEHVPSNRVSLACGILTAGLTAGSCSVRSSLLGSPECFRLRRSRALAGASHFCSVEFLVFAAPCSDNGCRRRRSSKK